MDLITIIGILISAIGSYYAWQQYKHLTSQKIPHTDITSKPPQSEELPLIQVKGEYNIVSLEPQVRSANEFIRITENKEKDLFYTPQKPSVLFNDSLFAELILKIKRTRMIILWGIRSSRNDKNLFARAFAYQVKAEIDELKILEWQKNTDIYDIPVLLTEKDAGIYLLTDITPQMVHYNLEAIHAVVQRKSHYLIITTNIVLGNWMRFTQAVNLFQEITAKMLYNGGYLALNLVELLGKSSLSLPLEIRNEFLVIYNAQKNFGFDLRELLIFPLSQNRSIEYVAERLRGYDDLDTFVRILSEDENRVFNDEIIDDIINKITSKDWDFLKWYYNDLKKRDRHLLLAMSLFSGLYENQFFAAIEELVEHEWRIREPVLDAFDYEELDILKNYAVDFIETGEIERKIEIKPHLRKHIFNECWHNHRRLIVSSIQGMMNIVKNSIYKHASFRPMYEIQITEETINKLKQLDIPDYILQELQKMKDRTYYQWFELLDALKDSLGEHSFELFQDKFKVIFDSNNFLTDDNEFREISSTFKKSQLYRTNDKIKLIHRVIGSALRQIAYESPSLAEEALFFYASERDIFMRNLAALSLAQWRNREDESENNKKYERELYEVLNRWHKEPEKIFDPFGAGLSTSKKDFVKERKEFYFSTIILTIGFAATYDEPNQCAVELLNLLKEFIPPLLEVEAGPAQWEAVEGALGTSTVPLLIKCHLAQLHEDGLLYDLMRYASSAIYIAYELSFTYLKNPLLFNRIIDRLNDICEQLKSIEKKHKKRVEKLRKKGIPESEIALSRDMRIYPPRKRLMSILIATYGNLPFIDGEGWLTAQETFQRLKYIFKSEPEESMLRDAVADAVKAQISRDFYNLKDEIRSILVIFNLNHYLRIVPGFYPMILKERKDLEKKLAKKKKEEEEKLARAEKETILEGTVTEIDDDALDSEKRITKSEEEMFDWILEGGRRFRLIGFLALFGAYLTQLNKKDKLKEFDQLITKKVHKKLFLSLLITPLCLFGLGSPFVIIHLLPMVVTLKSIFSIEIEEILKIWRSKIEKKSIRRLGWALTISLFFANHFVLIVTVYLSIGFVIWRLINLY